MEKIITDILMDVATLVEVRRLTTRFVDLTQSRNADTVKSWLADFTNGEVREFDGTKVAPYIIESANYQVEVLPFEIRVLKAHFASYVKAGDTKDNEDHNAPVSDNAVNGSDYDIDKERIQAINIIQVDYYNENGVVRKRSNIRRDIELLTNHQFEAHYEEELRYIEDNEKVLDLHKLYDGNYYLVVRNTADQQFEIQDCNTHLEIRY